MQVFTFQFESHVKSFINKHQLIPSNCKSIYIAVSGGVDSMTLYSLMNKLYGDKYLVQAIHINHGTRAQNLDEERLVQAVCIEPIIIKANFDLKSSNFEHLGHEFRYDVFKKYLNSDSILLTAHHLDDSFEWSLLAQMKFNTAKACLGIPLVNGRIRRPFLCLSKKQLKKYAAIQGIKFLEDSSNLSCDKDRNYLRNTVIPLLAKRYPSYLKHYAKRSNLSAREFGLHLLKLKKTQILATDRLGGIVIETSEINSSQIYQTLLAGIKQLSKTKRGKLDDQIEKVINCLGRKGLIGPFLFSGQVKALLLDGLIYLYGPEVEEKILKIDSQISGELNFQKVWSEKPLQFPFLVECPKNSRSKRIKSGQILFPNLVNRLIDTNIDLTYWTRLRRDSKKVRHIDPLALDVLG